MPHFSPWRSMITTTFSPAAILLDLTTSVHCVFLYEDGRVEFRSRVRTTRVSAKDIRAMEYVRGQEGAPALCRVVWDGGSIVVSNDLEGLDELEGNLRRHNRWFVGRFQDEHFRH